VRIIRLHKIGVFLAELVRSHVARPNLESGYTQMAKDKEREKEALDWAEGTFRDTATEAEQGHSEGLTLTYCVRASAMSRII